MRGLSYLGAAAEEWVTRSKEKKRVPVCAATLLFTLRLLDGGAKSVRAGCTTKIGHPALTINTTVYLFSPYLAGFLAQRLGGLRPLVEMLGVKPWRGTGIHPRGLRPLTPAGRTANPETP